MIFGESRAAIRQTFGDAWRKAAAGEPLSPLEAQVAAVVAEHPEFHEAVLNAHDAQPSSGEGGINPFFHMGLHLAIRDQVSLDRPAGVKDAFARLCARYGDAHAAEHAMFEALAETLKDAQAQRSAPDDARYLERLRRLA